MTGTRILGHPCLLFWPWPILPGCPSYGAAPGYLTGAKAADAADESLSLRLLHDLEGVFGRIQSLTPFPKILKNRLRAVEDGPWSESEIDLTERKLARMLKGFKLRPATVRLGEKTKKGYSREEFEAASAPYLADDPSQASQPA